MDLTWLADQNPILLAFLATLGTYLLTALGTTPVFFLKHAPRWLLDVCTGFAAGVMVAASCWSLLEPALREGGIWPAIVGLAVGTGFLLGMKRLFQRWRVTLPGQGTDGDERRRQGPVLLMFAMTIHNFPEGLAIGVAYGAGNLGAATALAIGIGLQNIPEGLAVALPLRRQGMSRGRAFWYGQLSAIVEPIAGPLGAALVVLITALMPYGMAFAAGAMLVVVVQELLPEACRDGHIEAATLGFMIGFTVMMALDNAFG